ncbi:MAG: hypothetical protein IJA12_03545 [Oscillospiraceae bacterium]|nr:hypothetical protein [Oscillospiraceae bacterium]
MNKADSLKGMLQKMAPSGTDLIIGTVILENPLRVQALNDDKLIVRPTVPARLSNLKNGEYVHLLVLNGGKKYYVLDRR